MPQEGKSHEKSRRSALWSPVERHFILSSATSELKLDFPLVHKALLLHAQLPATQDGGQRFPSPIPAI